MPTNLIETRKDVYKILYTKESPNIRHAQQWNPNFLSKFDKVLTYWNPLIGNEIIEYCPFIHRLCFDIPIHRNLLQNNNAYDKRIVMVLECRDLSGSYNIADIELHCMDPIRKTMGKFLKNLTVVGPGWKNFYDDPKTIKPEGLKVVDTGGGRWDDRTVIEHLNGYTFNLVLENCDAVGYVSEKIYDSFMADCIPLYLGNVDSNLPKIPEDMYIDLRKFDSVDSINKYIESLTYEEIDKYKKSIRTNRESVLRNVSPDILCRKVKKIYEDYHNK